MGWLEIFTRPGPQVSIQERGLTASPKPLSFHLSSKLLLHSYNTFLHVLTNSIQSYQTTLSSNFKYFSRTTPHLFHTLLALYLHTIHTNTTVNALSYTMTTTKTTFAASADPKESRGEQKLYLPPHLRAIRGDSILLKNTTTEYVPPHLRYMPPHLRGARDKSPPPAVEHKLVRRTWVYGKCF